jgi:hypothetical protein
MNQMQLARSSALSFQHCSKVYNFMKKVCGDFYSHEIICSCEFVSIFPIGDFESLHVRTKTMLIDFMSRDRKNKTQWQTLVIIVWGRLSYQRWGHRWVSTEVGAGGKALLLFDNQIFHDSRHNMIFSLDFYFRSLPWCSCKQLQSTVSK